MKQKLETLKKTSPITYELLRQIYHFQELKSGLSFLMHTKQISFVKRLNILWRFIKIQSYIQCGHSQTEMLEVSSDVLDLQSSGEGVIVEAGCFKGGSASKLSIVSLIKDKKLYLFDSFEGIPENNENHGDNIFGEKADFRKGDYCGELNEVLDNVEKYGYRSVCCPAPGWFEDTMPQFRERVCLAYIDVDLVSSTRTCIKYLYPLLVPGGVIFSQDGHLPLIISLLDDPGFWMSELGVVKPEIIGLGEKKLIKIIKPM